jgi:hypothetical protein
MLTLLEALKQFDPKEHTGLIRYNPYDSAVGCECIKSRALFINGVLCWENSGKAVLISNYMQAGWRLEPKDFSINFSIWIEQKEGGEITFKNPDNRSDLKYKKYRIFVTSNSCEINNARSQIQENAWNEEGK